MKELEKRKSYIKWGFPKTSDKCLYKERRKTERVEGTHRRWLL
jgi:hypothetical protein